MRTTSIPGIYLTAVLAMAASPLSQAAADDHQHHAEHFSDPDYVADPAPGFAEQAIQYDDRVADDVEVVITLGQQTYPALHAVIEELAQQKNIKIDIQQGTCGVTTKKLLRKSVDIGTFCCPPADTDRLPGLKFHTIAISPVALITHKDNPINNVSTIDAQKIFRGEYVTWSEVPGHENVLDTLKGERIQPVVRPHCEKKPGHWRALMHNQDEFSPRVQSVGTIPDMIAEVADDINAIGYETPYMLKVHKEKGDLKILSIDGMNPEDPKNLITGKYPVYRAYNMSTWSNENNRNIKAEIMMDAIYDYVKNYGEQYGFVSAAKLKSAGWKFKDRELIAGPDGQALISEH